MAKTISIAEMCDQILGKMKEPRKPLDLAPKSMRYWFEKNGQHLLRFEKNQWRKYPIFYTKKSKYLVPGLDTKRMIRILVHLDRMDVCDGTFDRWANSTGAGIMMPRTEQEFNKQLTWLLANYKTFEERMKE